MIFVDVDDFSDSEIWPRDFLLLPAESAGETKIRYLPKNSPYISQPRPRGKKLDDTLR